jgi:hypothetical protein
MPSKGEGDGPETMQDLAAVGELRDPVFSGEAGALLLKWKMEADATRAEAERLKAEAERLRAAHDLDQNAREWAKRTKGTERSGLQ